MQDWYEGNPYGDPVPTIDETTWDDLETALLLCAALLAPVAVQAQSATDSVMAQIAENPERVRTTTTDLTDRVDAMERTIDDVAMRFAEAFVVLRGYEGRMP